MPHYHNALLLVNVNTPHKCKICNIDINIDSSHIFSLNLSNQLKIQNYCNHCIPSKYLYIKNNSIFIDYNNLNTDYIDNQLTNLGLKIDNMIAVSTACSKYNTIKTHINYVSKLGWFPIHKIFTTKFNTTTHINLIEKSKIEEYFHYKNNGEFILRQQKIINLHGPSPHNPPYNLNFGKNQFTYHNHIENKKSCNHCFTIKDITEFYQKNNKIHNYCKTCSTRQNKVNYKSLNKEEKKKLFTLIKEWGKNNRDKIKSYQKNPQNKLIRNLRKSISELIRKRQINGLTSIDPIRQNVLKHIESQFIEGMSWDNYGPGYKRDENGSPIYDESGNIIKTKEWTVDHIIPVSSFNLADPEEIKKINGKPNLRPMWSEDNTLKSNKHVEEIEHLEFYQKYKLIKNICKNNAQDVRTLNAQVSSIIET